MRNFLVLVLLILTTACKPFNSPEPLPELPKYQPLRVCAPDMWYYDDSYRNAKREEDLKEAIRAWNPQDNEPLVILVGEENNCEVRISWTDYMHGGPNYAGEFGRVGIGPVIRINRDTLDHPNPFYHKGVVTHELGHALGLLHSDGIMVEGGIGLIRKQHVIDAADARSRGEVGPKLFWSKGLTHVSELK